MVRRHLRPATDRPRTLNSPKPDNWEKRTFSQKVKWRCKHPDPKVDYASWVDKYEAKSIVAGLFSVPRTYAVVRYPEEIVALTLPDTFVMKATHGWNMSLLVENGIVRGSNRSRRDAGRPSDLDYLSGVAIEWMNSKSEARRRKAQLHYRQVDFGVMFEAYVQPVDYELQLFLFEGRFKLALVAFRSFMFQNTAHQIYDEEWTLREALASKSGMSPPPSIEIPRPPARLFKALERLCRRIDHVRVDFLVSDGRYYFSEFTFTHNGPYGPGLLARFDAQLGRCWPR